MKKILSGAQPTGVMHIGNYIGALKQWVQWQDDHECLFMVVDLHALTLVQDPHELRENIMRTAALYLALGIDPKKSIIFVQSDVKEHAELCWVLNTIARMSELKLMHQFKDKSQSHPENINVGLFDYPVLMASDILLYDVDLVPVGEDQKQHVELTRELARRFNTQYGKTFKMPEMFIPKTGGRIMGLDDPLKKMSKSASSELNYISLTDTPDVIKKKIQRAVTDTQGGVKTGKDKPALTNLIEIYHLFSNDSVEDIEARYEGKGYKEFKENLTEVLIQFLQPFQKKFSQYLTDRQFLQTVLKQGAKDARVQAEATMKKVKDAVGFGY
ncbi:MAG: tryptophan--tRNA ligase [bacterium]|nr:tryptophan--tRNA ligase [bacterium]